jgi:hypothetical protein
MQRDLFATECLPRDVVRDEEAIELPHALQAVERGAADLKGAAHIADAHAERQWLADKERAVRHVEDCRARLRLARLVLQDVLARAHG